MKRVFFLLAVAVIFATAFTSCKKDEENANTGKLLKTITVCCIKSDGHDEDIGRYDKYKFEYDKQNRITKMSEYYYDGILDYSKTFVYAGDDLVQVLYSSSSGYEETYEYTKNGNTITEKDTYNGGDRISIIELDSDGLPIKREREELGNIYVDIYEYQDENLTKITQRFTIPEYDYTESHTYNFGYDNQKGALYHCKTPKWCLILHLNDFGVKNNITESSYTRSYTEYTYKFGVARLPSKRTYKNTWGMVGHVKEWVEEFTYIRK